MTPRWGGITAWRNQLAAERFVYACPSTTCRRHSCAVKMLNRSRTTPLNSQVEARGRCSTGAGSSRSRLGITWADSNRPRGAAEKYLGLATTAPLGQPSQRSSAAATLSPRRFAELLGDAQVLTTRAPQERGHVPVIVAFVRRGGPWWRRIGALPTTLPLSWDRAPGSVDVGIPVAVA